MSSAAVLQKKLNKGEWPSPLPCLLQPPPHTDRPSGQPKPAKKLPRYASARKSGDIMPPVSFCMKPTPLSLFTRQRLGGRSLARAARHPTTTISPKTSPKPSRESLSVAA